MQGLAVRGEDQVGWKGADVVLRHQVMCVGVPGLCMGVVLCGGIELDLDVDEFGIEVVAGLFRGEDGRAHKPAGAAPGGIAIDENIFVLRFRFGLDGGPAEFVFEVDAFVLRRGQERQEEEGDKAGFHDDLFLMSYTTPAG